MKAFERAGHPLISAVNALRQAYLDMKADGEDVEPLERMGKEAAGDRRSRQREARPKDLGLNHRQVVELGVVA